MNRLNDEWLKEQLKRLRFYADLFNRCSREGDQDGASEAWNEAARLHTIIQKYTGWSAIEMLTKY